MLKRRCLGENKLVAPVIYVTMQGRNSKRRGIWPILRLTTARNRILAACTKRIIYVQGQR